jgi:probable rRNA maturation factor
MRAASARPAAGRGGASGRRVGGGSGGGGGEIEITLLNPNGYAEAAARRLRPWLRAVLAALLAEHAPEAPAGAERAAGPQERAVAAPERAAGPQERVAGPERAPAAAPEAIGRSLGVRFAGDRAVRRANRQFRGKDQTTDVLSFPGGAGAGGHLGDVLISVPQARRQAAAAERDAERELRVLLLHGVLHCLGYDHEVDGGEMARLERRLRRRWLGAGGTARRARRGG